MKRTAKGLRGLLDMVEGWIELRERRNLTNTLLVEVAAALQDYVEELEKRTSLNCLACGQLTDEPGRMHQHCVTAIVTIRNEGVNIGWLADQIKRGKIVP